MSPNSCASVRAVPDMPESWRDAAQGQLRASQRWAHNRDRGAGSAMSVASVAQERSRSWERPWGRGGRRTAPPSPPPTGACAPPSPHTRTTITPSARIRMFPPSLRSLYESATTTSSVFAAVSAVRHEPTHVPSESSSYDALGRRGGGSQAVAPAATLEHTPRELIDDHDLRAARHILPSPSAARQKTRLKPLRCLRLGAGRPARPS
eukprot:1225328-Rhodomonas_salina.2